MLAETTRHGRRGQHVDIILPKGSNLVEVTPLTYRGVNLDVGRGLKFVKLGQFWKIIAHSRALELGS